MTNESELIHALDTIAFELHTSNEEKLQSIQNLLYQYEQMVTAQSVYAESSEEYDTAMYYIPETRRI
jgi:hypothetical protein